MNDQQLTRALIAEVKSGYPEFRAWIDDMGLNIPLSVLAEQETQDGKNPKIGRHIRSLMQCVEGHLAPFVRAVCGRVGDRPLAEKEFLGQCITCLAHMHHAHEQTVVDLAQRFEVPPSRIYLLMARRIARQALAAGTLCKSKDGSLTAAANGGVSKRH
jgi:hypothetical protein